MTDRPANPTPTPNPHPGTTPRLYFDNAATSFPKPPAVIDAISHFHNHLGASPGRGAYRETRLAAEILAETREMLRSLFNAESAEHVVFTHNTSDALNLAIKGILRPSLHPDRKHIHAVTTDMEHNSILRPLNALADEFPDRFSFTRVPADPETGLIDPEALRNAITPHTRLVAAVHASNVTGTLQPIATFGQVCRDMAVPILVDAAQTAGHIPIDVQATNIDLLAVPGHKGLLGPLGTAALVIRPGLEKLIHTSREGGTGSVSELDTHPDTMPDKFEPGSHNTIGIAGLHAALRYILDRTINDIHQHQQSLISTFINGIHQYTGGPLLPGLRLLGPQGIHHRVGVFAVTVENLHPAKLADQLEQRFGVLTRPGIHCAPHVHRTFHTDPDAARTNNTHPGATRFSIGPFLSLQDVQHATDALATICHEHADNHAHTT